MKKTYVFIDANIFLNFYREIDHRHDDLKQLKKLVTEQHKYILVTPPQAKEEYYRNREIVIAKTHENIETLRGNLITSLPDIKSIPSDILSDDVISKIKGIQKSNNKELNSIFDELLEIHNKNSNFETGKTNSLIEDVFEISKELKEDIDVLKKAEYRTLKGNPPKKGVNSFGDAINWESLLKYCDDGDLIIVSADNDFSSKMDNEKLKEFLKNEWESKTGNEANLVKTFAEILNKIAKKKIKNKKAISREKELGYTNYLIGLQDSKARQALQNYMDAVDVSKEAIEGFRKTIDIESIKKVIELNKRFMELGPKNIRPLGRRNDDREYEEE